MAIKDRVGPSAMSRSPAPSPSRPPRPEGPAELAPYGRAFLDWGACAIGARLRTPLDEAPEGGGLLEDVAHLGFAGHLLDFDDTYAPGLAHVSAPTAPAAVVLAAHLGRDVGGLLAAYSAGFEVMAAFSAASHPALYDRGWHPTAVCGSVGAAVAASSLLELDTEHTEQAVRLALLSAAGLRAAFGSHGKAYQVGRAAADGVLAARTAARGAVVPASVVAGAGSFADVYGGDLADALHAPPPGRRAVEDNWIKAYPCCLQTHATIDAGLELAKRWGPHPPREVTITVHPVTLQAAGAPAEVRSGLEAKFSVPYTTAWAVLRGPPTVESFDLVDEEVRALAGGFVVGVDEQLDPNACRLEWQADGRAQAVRIEQPRGSPARPLDDSQLHAKVRSLGAEALVDALADLSTPATQLAELLGVGGRHPHPGSPATREVGRH